MMIHRILFSLPVFALLVAMLPSIPARADDAADLLAKHKAYVGWQFGDGTFDNGVHVVGQYSHDDKGKTVVTSTISTLRLGALYRTTTHDQKTGRNNDDGFTGNLFWASDENGFIHPVLGDSEKSAISYQVFLNEATTALPGTLHGTATVDGIATQIVRVAPQGALPMDLYVDPATGAYKRVVVDPGGDNEFSEDIRSYLDAGNGKKIVGVLGSPGSTYVTSFTKIEGATVRGDELHPPPQTAQWAFTSSAPFHIKISDTRIFVDATINGFPGHFILDTGDGSGITLLPEFATRAHLTALEDTSTYGYGGAAKDTLTKIDSIQIGGNTLSNFIGDYLDIGGLKQEADGLIGQGLMGGAVVRLNFDASTLSIEPPSTDVSQVPGMHTTVDLSEGGPQIPMKLDGSITVNTELDSGTPLYVVFGKDMIYKYGLRMIRGERYAGGVGGVEVEECGHIDEIDLGPAHYQSPSACISPSFGGRDGLVGISFMKHFNFVFDYPQALVVITPNQQP
jgi:hypothetical protein